MPRNIEELRSLSLEELRVRLADAEEELANLKFQNGSGQLDSPIRVRLARRDVARINTLITEMVSAPVEAPEKA
jgi:large subunit ribosomal protein L29